MDVNILKEIARVVQSRAKVPERIQVQNRTFLITYLDDHRQRIEEALRRHDPDRLNMLFGQLESKVKYQVVRNAQKQAAGKASRSTSRSKSPSGKSTAKSQTSKSRTPAAGRKSTAKKKAKKAGGSKSTARKPAPKRRQTARKRVR